MAFLTAMINNALLIYYTALVLLSGFLLALNERSMYSTMARLPICVVQREHSSLLPVRGECCRANTMWNDL